MIVNTINDKVYIGLTSKTIEERFKEHVNKAKYEEKIIRPLYTAMRKYGVENFYICSLEEVDTKDKILLLEDVTEEPYSIDRYLATLKIAGKLRDAKAIIFGYFTNCDKADPNDDTQTYMDVLYEYTKDLTCPVIYNFPTGHDRPFVNVPIGLKAKVDIEEESVIVLEDLFFDK